MFSWLWKIYSDRRKRAFAAWLGAGLVAAATVVGPGIGFIVERMDDRGKKDGGAAVTVGQGIGTGGDATFHGPVSFGPSPEHIDQIQQPWIAQLATKDAQIAALTELLLQRNPSPAPGAHQAISEAVGSITAGAARGESRLERALALLKSNRIAEAAHILQAVAEEKTAQAEKDRKEAAIAYRNLGAIAGLKDPKKALEAYRKALELDPDDVESALWVGWILKDYGDLAEAELRLRRALTLATAEGRASFEYWAVLGLGDIELHRGDLSGALKAFLDSLPIADRLGKSDPNNAGWQRDLSVSYDRVGDVQVAQGDLSGALKAFSDSLAIRERLVKSDPSNAGWQRDLSVSYDRIGDVKQAQGDLSGALKAFSDSLAIAERLTTSDPSNADWQRDLAMSHGKLGLVHRSMGQEVKAGDLFRRGREIMARLTQLSPDNARWKADLAQFDADIAELEQSASHPKRR